MKYAFSFILGALIATYVLPPQPTLEVDDMTRREIAYEVLELLEQEQFDILAAKRELVLQKKNKFSWF